LPQRTLFIASGWMSEGTVMGMPPPLSPHVRTVPLAKMAHECRKPPPHVAHVVPSTLAGDWPCVSRPQTAAHAK
jgi:hypothetical protein